MINVNSLRWVSARDLRAPESVSRADDELRDRVLTYIEECGLYPNPYMPPETWIGCELGCRDAGRPESTVEAKSDGQWAFASEVPHYPRRHRYSLPTYVLEDLRRRVRKSTERFPTTSLGGPQGA